MANNVCGRRKHRIRIRTTKIEKRANLSYKLTVTSLPITKLTHFLYDNIPSTRNLK